MRGRQFTLLHSIRVALAVGWSDFVLKYRGSVLGWLWSLIGPLVKFGVILFIFEPYVEGMIPMYRLYLFLGIIIWEHFSVTTSSCMSMLFDKASIIQRLPFPRVLLIFAAGWTNAIVLATHLAVFWFYCWWTKAEVAWSSVYLPISIVEMTLLALGVGMLLSAYSLKYRDIPHLWNIALQILFWLTPIMYLPPLKLTALSGAIEAVQTIGTHTVGGLTRTFIGSQPLSVIMHDARRSILYPDLWGVPTTAHTIGTLIVCLTVFLLGLAVFQRRQAFFAQEY